MLDQLPVLYSFRRCPYAIRARLAIRYSKLNIELREVDLKNKPTEMLLASPKATVPVLVCQNNKVIDESLDIMRWSLKQNDPQNWTQKAHQSDIEQLIDFNDTQFKIHLDHYKYADRFPQQDQQYYRQQGEVFLQQLEKRLNHCVFLVSDTASIADIALFPFIRQFAFVDIKWFETSPYPKLRNWLTNWLDSELFQSIMIKQPVWSFDMNTHQPPIIL